MHVRISTLPFSYLVMYPTPGRLGGDVGAPLHAILTSMNVTYELLFPRDPQNWGICLTNGTCVGQLGDIMSGRADIGSGPFGMIEIDVGKFHTTPVSVVDGLVPITAIVTTHAIDSSSFFRMIDALGYIMLMLVVLFVPLAIVLMEATVHAAKDHSAWTPLRYRYDFYNLVTATLAGIFSVASKPVLLQGSSSRLALATFALMETVMTITFSGIIMASIMVKSPTSRIETLQDLADATQVRPLAAEGTLITNMLRSVDDPRYRTIYKRAERMGLCTHENLLSQESMDAAVNGTAAYFFSCITSKLFLAPSFRRHKGKAWLFCGSEPAMEYLYSSYFSKSLDPSFVAEALTRFQWTIDMPSRWIHPFMLGATEDEFYTNKARTTSSSDNALTVTELEGVAVACAGLYALSLATLLLEVMLYHTRKYYTT